MGADFKEKAAKSFDKCWDKAAVRANTPDMFSKTADRAPSRFEAEAIGDAPVSVGDSVCLRLENGKLIGRRGVSPVLTIAVPTSDLVRSVEESCNIARAEVVAADPISGVLEVTVN